MRAVWEGQHPEGALHGYSDAKPSQRSEHAASGLAPDASGTPQGTRVLALTPVVHRKALQSWPLTPVVHRKALQSWPLTPVVHRKALQSWPRIPAGVHRKGQLASVYPESVGHPSLQHSQLPLHWQCTGVQGRQLGWMGGTPGGHGAGGRTRGREQRGAVRGKEGGGGGCCSFRGGKAGGQGRCWGPRGEEGKMSRIPGGSGNSDWAWGRGGCGCVLGVHTPLT